MPTDTSFQRLKALILFIAEEGKDDPALGAVKLNKILYFADVRAYMELKKPITGVKYQHLSEGPAPRALIPARNELEAEKAIELETSWYLNRRQQRIKVLKPNKVMFDEAQLRIVREAMDELKHYNASEVSELAHREWAWKLTQEGQDIPLELAWISSDPLTQEQEEHGRDFWHEMRERG